MHHHLFHIFTPRLARLPAASRQCVVWIILFAVLAMSVTPLAAQDATSIDQLQQQLRQMQEEAVLQRQRMDALERQLETLQRQHEAAATTPTAPPVATPLRTAESSWRPTDPIRIAGNNRAYLNLSFDGLFSAGVSTADDVEALQPGGHDPNQRGFTVQNFETIFEGMADPYFRGQAAIIYQIDAEGESFLEVEEGYLETLSLPGNLQFKAGQYLSEFGRLNQTHPHTWDFADQPLVLGRLLGGDGMRNVGARLSWLTPTPFYSELYLSAQNSHGETAFSFRNGNDGEPLFGRLVDQGAVRSFNDLLLVPRYTASFDLTEAQTLVAGVSAAFGPNSTGRDAETQIYGADLFWKWKAPDHTKGFPFVSWQTEALARRYEAGAFDWDLNGDGILDPDEQDNDSDGVADFVPRETLNDWGVYSQLVYGCRPGWTLGLRGDYMAGETADYERMYGVDLERADRWRVSPNVTWYPTEFSKLRLQYNYDDRDRIDTDQSLWVQFEFLLGAHGAHKF